MMASDTLAGTAIEVDDDFNFGSDIELDEELETILHQAESQVVTRNETTSNVKDIEDAVPRLSPFLEFRKKGWLSVSDLVGTVWCEVQVR